MADRRLWNTSSQAKAPQLSIDTPPRSPDPSHEPLVPTITSPSSPTAPWPPHRRRASTLVESLDLNTEGPNNSVPQADDALPPRISEKAQNGFLAVCLTYIAFGLYLLWAFLPRSWTTWLPDKEWTIIIPSYLMTIVLLTYFSYASLMAYNTPSFDSSAYIADAQGQHPKLASSSTSLPSRTAVNPFSALSSSIALRSPSHVSSSMQPPLPKPPLDEPFDVPLSIMNNLMFPPRKKSERYNRKS